MDLPELTGTYTYRSFQNVPQPVDDFNRLRFAQLELRLRVDGDGAVTGELVFPTADPAAEPGVMDITGKAGADELTRVALAGRGRGGTATAQFQYDYDGVLLPSWAAGIDQRPTIAGTVLRVAAHGPGAPAGLTASFLAVRRDDQPGENPTP